MSKREDIPVGRANAVTRRELAEIWGMSDRNVREMIAKLRMDTSKDPYAILSSSRDPAGYWRSNDPHEIEAFVRETRSRAIKTLALLQDVKRVRKMYWGRRDA